MQAPHSVQESDAPEKAHARVSAVQAAKQLAAAALASLQIAAVPFAAELAQPPPAAAVLNSPNARIARRYVSRLPRLAVGAGASDSSWKDKRSTLSWCLPGVCAFAMYHRWVPL